MSAVCWDFVACDMWTTYGTVCAITLNGAHYLYFCQAFPKPCFYFFFKIQYYRSKAFKISPENLSP